MAKRQYDLAETHEMEEFVENLRYWCSKHPNPKFCKSCDNLGQCKKSPACQFLTLNSSENTYTKLASILSNQPAAKTIRDYYADWDGEKIRFKKTALATKLITYLREFAKNPSLDDEHLEEYNSRLKDYYYTFKLEAGCELSTKALGDYPLQIDIIRWWSLFHNRKMKWSVVREVLQKKVAIANEDAVIAECYLGIFESWLNEYTKNRHKHSVFTILQDAKNNYLDRIPGKERNGKYYYFLARFMEEEWWLLPNGHPKATSTIIFHAIASINKSISLYVIDKSGYTAIDITPWWLFCHKALLQKIWGHPDFTKTLDEYGNLILEEIELNPERKSTQMYAIAYFVLSENVTGLERFLEHLDDTLKRRQQVDDISIEENKVTTVDNLSYRYIELVFYDNLDKQKMYHQIITRWFQRNVH